MTEVLHTICMVVLTAHPIDKGRTWTRKMSERNPPVTLDMPRIIALDESCGLISAIPVIHNAPQWGRPVWHEAIAIVVEPRVDHWCNTSFSFCGANAWITNNDSVDACTK